MEGIYGDILFYIRNEDQVFGLRKMGEKRRIENRIEGITDDSSIEQ